MDREPKVRAEALRAVIEGRIPRGADGNRCGEAITLLAELAGTSPRTVYRVLDPRRTKPIDLDLADRLLMAADGPNLGELPSEAFTAE